MEEIRYNKRKHPRIEYTIADHSDDRYVAGSARRQPPPRTLKSLSDLNLDLLTVAT